MQARDRTGLEVLVGGAALVIVVAGMKAAAGVIVPVLVAGFFSVISIPPMRWLRGRGVGQGLSIAIVFSGVLLALAGLTLFVGSSLRDFSQDLDTIEKNLQGQVAGVVAWLQGMGVEVSLDQVREGVDGETVMSVVRNVASATSAMLSNTAFVLLTVAFMLAEVATFKTKLRMAMGNPTADISRFRSMVDSLQGYLAIKTQVSLMTGLTAFLLNVVLGVNHALLWGVVAFLLNFIPTLGSVIAAIPAVLLALLEVGPGTAGISALGYVGINLLFGNVIEPRMMGRRLGLSPLVVFLSLVFWGWVWGPVGMLLSVPLTMCVKLLLEDSEHWQWVAIILGPGVEPPDGGPATREPQSSAADPPPTEDSTEAEAEPPPENPGEDAEA